MMMRRGLALWRAKRGWNITQEHGRKATFPMRRSCIIVVEIAVGHTGQHTKEPQGDDHEQGGQRNVFHLRRGITPDPRPETWSGESQAANVCACDHSVPTVLDVTNPVIVTSRQAMSRKRRPL